MHPRIKILFCPLKAVYSISFKSSIAPPWYTGYIRELKFWQEDTDIHSQYSWPDQGGPGPGSSVQTYWVQTYWVHGTCQSYIWVHGTSKSESESRAECDHRSAPE